MTRYDTAQVTLFDGADVQPVLNSNGPTERSINACSAKLGG